MPKGVNRAARSSKAGLLAGAMAAAVAGLVAFVPLQAQEVVQALPPREAAQLNAALRRLAARPTDLEALLSAGNASLALHDAGAAAGFFNRASAVAPSDPRVLLGQARLALEQRRPVAALQGFALAEKAGLRPADMAADRALAYDLVGDNAAAQALYRSVLAGDNDNEEVRRRLALSLAISGNRSEFERVLYPMLRKEDRAAFRTRAFGLAVLGRTDEAVAIADAMMPTDLALRMAPYLRYMPRLTKAQQAAAANLGAFPAAAEIGRDSDEIASYASAGARIAANASASLTPTGAPLGPRSQAQPQAQPRAVSAPSSARPRSTTGTAVRVAAEVPATPGVLGPRLAAGIATSSAASQSIPGVLTPRPTIAATAPAPAATDRPSVAPASVAPARVVAATPSAPAPTPAPAARVSLAEAFADLGAPPPAAAATPPAGAVDIMKLAPARRVAASEAPAKPAPAVAAKAPEAKAAKPAPKPKPKVEKPSEPARFWAQIGVGRNTAAFAFDWRKLAKQADGALDGKGPWAVKYGATNRMLAGPYPTEAAARAAIKTLKDKDIEALPFASGEGEKVTKIG